METKFNFNSQVCTSKIQSERLLALGLKKETADMVHTYLNRWDGYHIHEHDWSDISCDEQHIPAWSLHRLIEMMPPSIRDRRQYSLVYDIHRDWLTYLTYGTNVNYLWDDQEVNPYDASINCIEWLIKEGYFNKEYLV